MDKLQASIITVFLLGLIFFFMPMILGEFTLGFDIPFFGHYTLFDPGSFLNDYGFFIGGTLAIIIMYIFVTKRRKGFH